MAQRHSSQHQLCVHASDFTVPGQIHQHTDGDRLVHHHGFTGMHHGGVQDQGETRNTQFRRRLFIFTEKTNLVYDYSFILFPLFQGHIVKPKGVSIAVLAQYGVMPLTAFCFVKVGALYFTIQEESEICYSLKLYSAWPLAQLCKQNPFILVFFCFWFFQNCSRDSGI